MSSKRKTPPPRYWEEGHLSFAGSPAMGIYTTGVALAFKNFAPHIAARKHNLLFKQRDPCDKSVVAAFAESGRRVLP